MATANQHGGIAETSGTPKAQDIRRSKRKRHLSIYLLNYEFPRAEEYQKYTL
jgi:hypothetical protein